LLETSFPTIPPTKPSTKVNNTPSVRRDDFFDALWAGGAGGGGSGELNSFSSGDGVIQLVMTLFYRRITVASHQKHAFFTNS
jgi:hypothetical protein